MIRSPYHDETTIADRLSTIRKRQSREIVAIRDPEDLNVIVTADSSPEVACNSVSPFLGGLYADHVF